MAKYWKTLDHLSQDRKNNVDELEKVESIIKEEISKWKNNLIKQITTLEEKLKTDLSNAKTKNKDQLIKDNSEISELNDVVQEKKQELEFLKDHGSNNQLYLTLREHGNRVHYVVQRLQEMTLSYKKAVLKFEKASNINIKSFGTILETKEACDVQHSLVKLQHAQVLPGSVVTLQTFKKETTEQLNCSKNLNITDIAVTIDKVFFCNYQTYYGWVYVYNINKNKLEYNTSLGLLSEPYGISIITGTTKAVITLPGHSHLQFIDTKQLSLGKSVAVGRCWFGITTSEEYIAVGKSDEFRILKQNGVVIKNIVLSDDVPSNVFSLLYNHHKGSRKYGHVRRIQLDGTVLYQFGVSGGSGLDVDAKGNVYVSEENKSEVQRLLPDGRFRDVVLSEKDGIAKPYAIIFNESYTKFFVANNAGLVQIYNCK